MSIRYRLLEHHEWDRVRELMDATLIPDPAAASCAIAEDTETGQLLGLLFMQLTLHCEPLVLSSPNVNFSNLFSTLLESFLAHKGLRFYCFADKPVVARMAEHVGMKKTPYEVFEGEVK